MVRLVRLPRGWLVGLRPWPGTTAMIPGTAPLNLEFSGPSIHETSSSGDTAGAQSASEAKRSGNRNTSATTSGSQATNFKIQTATPTNPSSVFDDGRHRCSTLFLFSVVMVAGRAESKAGPRRQASNCALIFVMVAGRAERKAGPRRQANHYTLAKGAGAQQTAWPADRGETQAQNGAQCFVRLPFTFKISSAHCTWQWLR